MSNLKRHVKGGKIKWVITAIVMLVIIAVLTAICIRVFMPGAEEKPADEDVNTTTVACSEHVFNDQGICTNCGKGVDEVSYNLDVVTKDCAVRFFVGEEKKYESFGIGTNGYTISDIYDNVTVTATSTLSDSTLINVYKCTYSEDGEYEGYPAEGDNVLFEGKKYDKELVYTLSAIKPVYTFENSEAADCLYIFEIVKA